MSFESPGYLALVLLAPVAALAFLALARWRREAAARFAPAHPANALGTPPVAVRMLKASLIVLAVLVLAVALARPLIGEEHIVVKQEGADVVIALDVSRSMLATDVAPNRLASAVEQTSLLVERLRGHRVGLVIFAGTSLVRSPLTTDTAPLLAFLMSAKEDGTLVEPGSDLGDAVRTALRVLQDSGAETRLIVLVSDGEDHDGDVLSAANAAAGQGVLLYTSGFGTLSGAAVPDIEPINGVPVVSRINESLLRRVAVASPAGRYIAGDQLAEEATAINRLERSTLAEERQLLPIERFQWFALLALFLLVAETLVPERGWRVRLRRGWLRRLRVRRSPLMAVAGLFSLALVVGVACSSAADDLIAGGTDAFERGEYAEALEAFRSAAADDPDRPEPHYNAGIALHQLEEYELAASATVRAFPIDDPTDAAHGYYNLGSHYVSLGQLDNAFSAFRQSLLLDPNDRDAKYNLELVRQLMIEQATAVGSPGDEQPDADDGSEEPDGDTSDGLEAQQSALRQELQAAFAGAEDELTIAEALRALELAQELNSMLPLAGEFRRPSLPDGPNY